MLSGYYKCNCELENVRDYGVRSGAIPVRVKYFSIKIEIKHLLFKKYHINLPLIPLVNIWY